MNVKLIFEFIKNEISQRANVSRDDGGDDENVKRFGTSFLIFKPNRNNFASRKAKSHCDKISKSLWKITAKKKFYKNSADAYSVATAALSPII